ncbi:MAG: hypothetical protein L6Q95_00650 [Planctomycetes bacterium]|nr:hypothetical protein [Planctomycetota bacterium]
MGAFPTVCVFRPLQGSAMADEPPPRYEDTRRVMKHAWERCRDRGVSASCPPILPIAKSA